MDLRSSKLFTRTRTDSYFVELFVHLCCWQEKALTGKIVLKNVAARFPDISTHKGLNPCKHHEWTWDPFLESPGDRP